MLQWCAAQSSSKLKQNCVLCRAPLQLAEDASFKKQRLNFGNMLAASRPRAARSRSRSRSRSSAGSRKKRR
jgi:hypothetical protein